MIDQNLTNSSTKSDPASSNGIKNDNRLPGSFTWLYYNLAKYGHLCKICEVFYSDHLCPTGAWAQFC